MSLSSCDERTPTDRQSLTPLFKWAGGKRFLTQKLRELIPTCNGTYYEPFFGGGALFFSLNPRKAVLSDTNETLVEAYTEIRDRPDRVIKTLQRWPNDEEEYYRIRATSPSSAHVRAARLLYLTTLSFNGIHRVNLRGQFNVPYGYKTRLPTYDSNKINRISEALRGKTLVADDFEIVSTKARSGDVIYFDPPYTVAHSNNGFVKYNAKIFSWDDQIRLAVLADRLRSRGCHVIVSNADHASIRALYPKFNLLNVERFSIMAASSAHRQRITECIFHTGRQSC